MFVDAIEDVILEVSEISLVDMSVSGTGAIV